MKKIISKTLLSAFAILFVATLLSCVPSAQPGKVDFKELYRKPNTVIIDVRTRAEFAEDHIKEAINIPLHILPDSVESLKRFDNIILVCRSGKRSANAKSILDKGGLKNVYNGGGWASFQERYLSE